MSAKWTHSKSNNVIRLYYIPDFFFFIRTEQTLQNFKSRNILHPSAIPPSMNAHVFIAKVWKQSILFYHRNNIPHFYALVIFFWGVELLNPCVKNMSILLHTSRISLILDPPFPMREPHWLAGTTNRRVTGGLGTVGVFCKSWNNIEPNKFRICNIWIQSQHQSTPISYFA